MIHALQTGPNSFIVAMGLELAPLVRVGIPLTSLQGISLQSVLCLTHTPRSHP